MIVLRRLIHRIRDLGIQNNVYLIIYDIGIYHFLLLFIFLFFFPRVKYLNLNLILSQRHF